MTESPRRGPGGMAISSSRSAACAGVGLGQQLLVGAEAGLALGLAGLAAPCAPTRARGRGCAGGRRSALSSPASRACFCSSQRRVVALERDAAAAVELEDPLGDVVEEVAVVGDRDDRARVLLEEPLEPVDRLGVEVVGRLVEQQQVGVAEQQPAQRDAAPLAAGQRRDVGVVGRAAQGVHGDLDVALEVPGVGRGDLVLELGLLGADLLVVGVGVGPHGHDLVVPVDERLDLGDAVHHVALDVLGRVELRLLARGSRRVKPGRQAGLAGEAVVEPGHDPQQGRLAGAVRRRSRRSWRPGRTTARCSRAPSGRAGRSGRACSVV